MLGWLSVGMNSAPSSGQPLLSRVVALPANHVLTMVLTLFATAKGCLMVGAARPELPKPTEFTA